MTTRLLQLAELKSHYRKDYTNKGKEIVKKIDKEIVKEMDLWEKRILYIIDKKKDS